MKQKISILGAPMWLGQTRYGTNMGPDALRSAGLIKRLEKLKLDVADMGNISVGIAGPGKRTGENMKNAKTVVNANERLAAKVSNIVKSGSFPLVLGGDHSIAMGTIAGIARHYQNLGVIWYDAHADMNTPQTSPSGNIHGMPLAACMGLGPALLKNIGGYCPKVKAENIVLIGVRDIDPGEKALIANTNMKTYSPEDVKQWGIVTVMQEAIAYLSERCDGIHLSFDLDGIDPREIPGVGTPVAGGISYHDSLLGVQRLFQSGKITSAEFVEVNPLLDRGQITAGSTVNLIGALFGEALSGDMRQEDSMQPVPRVI
ncbi:arginase [Propionispora sp. 2/2-37]|uniref:arginase n=1 Tax=Propionispora sp. 2/2-37 TaxID=1677858 RepID=UPI0006BB7396|nr:arginase [Propionispora sp. 2/2-37]